MRVEERHGRGFSTSGKDTGASTTLNNAPAIPHAGRRIAAWKDTRSRPQRGLHAPIGPQHSLTLAGNARVV